MGQRHQLFIQAPTSVYSKATGDDTSAEGMTAWHHQWLYGTLPLATLKRLLAYNADGGDYRKIKRSNLLKTVLMDLMSYLNKYEKTIK